jgi:L-ascorbate metabolism protein UlaG (beta-lactamase superfamily)
MALLNLIFHGHACFRLVNSTYDVIIDPFITNNPLADVTVKDLHPTHILVTHGHGDHLGDAIALSKDTGAPIIAPNELALYCQSKGANIHPMHIGGSYQFSFGRVKLTPAWHGSAVIDEKGITYTGTPCGFLVHMDNKYIYHAGDTGLFGDMKLIAEMYPLACALLPIGDNYVMGPDDALRAATMLQAKLTVPMHYNTFPVIAQDPDQFVKKLKDLHLKGQVMKPGDKIILND